MDLSALERRRDPRTPAFVPITLCYHDDDEATPAHLLDLSTTGAGILTTEQNSPQPGQFLDLHFETPTNDGATESKLRTETGIVVNVFKPERGIVRAGIRFLQCPDLGLSPSDPKTLLSNHRKSTTGMDFNDRWRTAKNFGKSKFAGSVN